MQPHRRQNFSLACFALCLVFLGMLASHPGSAQAKPEIERLYILYCGELFAGDISLWSPGVDVGKSAQFSINCYLIKHSQGWLLWDTGVADAIAAIPEGDRSNPRLTLRRSKTLADQLDQLGVDQVGRVPQKANTSEIGSVMVRR